MKPGPIGTPAEILQRLAAEEKVKLAALSKMLRRPARYLTDFVRRGKPEKLEPADRQLLAAYFRGEAWWFGED